MSAPPLFGLALQVPGLPGIGPIVLLLVAVLVIMSVVSFVVARYKRCPPNQVLVVYGSGGTRTDADGRSVAKVVNGGGTFVWPVIQDHAFMDLTPHQIDIPLTDALSSENIRIQVPSVVTVAIGDTPSLQGNAATRLLGLSDGGIKELAKDIIFGQMRQVIASMEIEAINRNREQFREMIETALAPELSKVGLKLINVNIRDIADEGGFIEAIGRRAAAEAVQTANADVAEEERKGETRVAEARRDKEVAVAEAERDREIGVQTASKDQAVKIAELTRDRNVAEQRAGFQRDTQVADADRERRVSVADANATAVEGETQAQAKIAEANAELEVRKAAAYKRGETERRVAEAQVEEAEARAKAAAALADAERIEARERARLEAPARAAKAEQIVKAEADREATVLRAQGDAEGRFAHLEAEARGELERLQAKADGLRRIVDAAGGDPDAAFRLMLLEQLQPLARIAGVAIQGLKPDKVIMWSGGNGANGDAPISAYVRDIVGSLPPALETMMEGAGLQNMVSRFVREAREVAADGADTGTGEPASDGAGSEAAGEEDGNQVAGEEDGSPGAVAVTGPAGGDGGRGGRTPERDAEA